MRALSLLLVGPALALALASTALAQFDVDFSGSPLRGTLPLTVDFSGSTDAVSPFSWSWTFGDGLPGATGQQVQHTFVAPGVFEVRLTVVSFQPAGVVTEVKPAYIEVLPIDLGLGVSVVDPTGEVPHTVTFTGTHTGPAPESWSWDFGDGATGTGQVVEHTYAQIGSFDVTLTAQYLGQVESVVVEDAITTSAIPTSLQIGAANAEGVAPLTVAFSDLTEPLPDAWLWDFGDGGSSTEQHPEHTYEQVGVFDVTLQAWFGLQQESVTYHELVVVEPPLILPSFELDTTLGPAPLVVAFSDTSGGAPGTSWLWTFGDGHTATEQHPEHVYVQAGLHEVTLAVTAYGHTESVSVAGAVWVQPAGVSLAPPEVVGLPGGPVGTLALADVTADGRPDAVVVRTDLDGATGGVLVDVLPGDGAGGFGPAVTSASTIALVTGHDLADVDGDGAADLVLAAAERVEVLHGTPAAALVPGFVTSVAAAGGVVALDADGDGLRDLVASPRSFTVGPPTPATLFTGDGAGGFAVSPVVPFQFSMGLASFGSGSVRGLHRADYDDDGREDVLYLVGASGISGLGGDFENDGLACRRNLGDGTFGDGDSAFLSEVKDGAVLLAVGDVDGDGVPDAISDAGAEVIVAVGQGGGDLANPVTAVPGLQGLWPAVARAADLTGSGVDELLVAHLGSSQASRLSWVSLAHLDEPAVVEVPLPGLTLTRHLVVGDLDADGRTDALLMADSQAGTVLVRLRNLTPHPGFSVVGSGLAGSAGTPTLAGRGEPSAGQPVALLLEDAAPGAPVWLVAGLAEASLPFQGGVLVPQPDMLLGGLLSDPAGGLEVAGTWPPSYVPLTRIWWQAWIAEPRGWSASNGLLSVDAGP